MLDFESGNEMDPVWGVLLDCLKVVALACKLAEPSAFERASALAGASAYALADM